MNTVGQKGGMGLTIMFAVTLVMLVGALGFGAWAYAERQDYKSNADAKIAVATEAAIEKTKAAKEAEFIEREKEPLQHYIGPEEYGSVEIRFPKTWSGYVDQGRSGSQNLDGYFHPDIVPSTNSGTAYALRLQVVPQAYDQVLMPFENLAKVGKVKVTPYRLPKVPSVLGSRIDGEIVTGKNGSMVVIRLRDKTLKVWTESESHVNDLNTHILPNLIFVP